MREHVGHASGGEREPVLAHEHRGIAGERRGITRHVYEALEVLVGQRLHHLDRTLARRVEQYLVERTKRFKARARGGEEIGGQEARARRETIGGCVGLRAADEVAAPFDADDLRTAAGDWQREVAYAAEAVGHRFAWHGLEQRDR